jgi:hypothetical protein
MHINQRELRINNYEHKKGDMVIPRKDYLSIWKGMRRGL